MEEELTALLAPVAGGRRFWTRAPSTNPDGSLLGKPYLVMNVVDKVPVYNYRGPVNYYASRVQIDCYADTYTSVLATARQINDILSGYSGGNIQAIFMEGVRDLPAADTGEVTNLFRKNIDIIVHYTGE